MAFGHRGSPARWPLGVQRLLMNQTVISAPARAEELEAEPILPRHRNPASGDGGPNHWECWLRDKGGYTVVLCSPDGTAG